MVYCSSLELHNAGVRFTRTSLMQAACGLHSFSVAALFVEEAPSAAAVATFPRLPPSLVYGPLRCCCLAAGDGNTEHWWIATQDS